MWVCSPLTVSTYHTSVMVWSPHPRYVTLVFPCVIGHHKGIDREWEKEKVRGLAFNFPNVFKEGMVARISRYSFTEVSGLFMGVLQKSQARPPAKLHDKWITISWQIEWQSLLRLGGSVYLPYTPWCLFSIPRAQTDALTVLLICMGFIPPYVPFL